MEAAATEMCCDQMVQTQSPTRMTAHSGVEGWRSHDVDLADDVLVTVNGNVAVVRKAQGMAREPRERWGANDQGVKVTTPRGEGKDPEARGELE